MIPKMLTISKHIFQLTKQAKIQEFEQVSISKFPNIIANTTYLRHANSPANKSFYNKVLKVSIVSHCQASKAIISGCNNRTCLEVIISSDQICVYNESLKVICCLLIDISTEYQQFDKNLPCSHEQSLNIPSRSQHQY